MKRTLITIAAAAAILASCGGEDVPVAATELSIIGTDALAFEPDAFTIPAGQEVTVEFTSEESVEHDLVIEGVGMAARAGDEGHGDAHAMDDDHAMAEDDLHIAHADPGDSVTATFTVNEPGTYQLYCSVPGHRGAGMEATLTVLDQT